MKITYRNRPLPTWPRVGLLHANRNGGPMLKETSSWRSVSGVFFNVFERHVLVEFRRVYKSPRS